MKYRDEGFTLIEIIVSIAVIGLVVTAVFNINLAGWQFYNYNQDRVEIKNDARLISTNLERQIRKSAGASLQDIMGDSSLDLILSNGDTDGDGNINYKIFFVEDSQLKIGDINGTLNSSNVFNIRKITGNYINNSNYFSIPGPNDLVSFNFQLQKDNSSYTISNKFYPRTVN